MEKDEKLLNEFYKIYNSSSLEEEKYLEFIKKYALFINSGRTNEIEILPDEEKYYHFFESSQVEPNIRPTELKWSEFFEKIEVARLKNFVITYCYDLSVPIAPALCAWKVLLHKVSGWDELLVEQYRSYLQLYGWIKIPEKIDDLIAKKDMTGIQELSKTAHYYPDEKEIRP